MDSLGYSQIGRFGTLSLLKRQQPDTVITAFGIDSEELTFGRDPRCSVRLYYADVDLVHCKIIFSERKAFLVVLGSTGLLVDGCKVYPNGSAGAQPTTIPLSNNSEIEIHNKRFLFSYPPKEIRTALYATPARPNHKLRLSMINSAQVFSPRPSNDPRENLRILRSPLKNAFRSPTKPSTLSQSPINSSEVDEEEEENIVLVDGNYPRVVEEGKDLVILEDVEVPVVQPIINVQPPKTPQRPRSQSLHRAVLIRSVQKAVLHHERQREEDREEEMEVLETVANDNIDSDEDVNHDAEEAEHPPSDNEDTDSDEERGEEQNQNQRKSLWRKSLERLWPFKGDNPTSEETEETDDIPQEKDTSDGEPEDDVYEAQDQAKPLRALSQATPSRRPLGAFMTPQVVQPKTNLPNPDPANNSTKRRLAGGPPGRFSLGGEARRVPLEPIWRVKDIVVPVKGEDQEMNIEYDNSSSNISKSGDPTDSNIFSQAQPSPSRTRPPTSEHERKAIKERRRSALREIDSGFEGGIPGMSPSKPFASPTKPAFNDMNNPFRSTSPIKLSGSRSPVKDITRRLSTDDEDEKLDTRSLLERMKETVEGMKRRRSTIGTPGPSPTKSSMNSDSLNRDKGANPLDLLLDAHEDKENQNTTVDEGSSERVKEIHVSETHEAEPARTLEPTVPENISVPIIVEETTDGEDLDASTRALPQNARDDASNLEVPVRRSRTRSRSPQPPVEHTTVDPVRRTRQVTARMEVIDRSDSRKAPSKRNPGVDLQKSSIRASTLVQDGPASKEARPDAVVGRSIRKTVVKEEKEDKPLRQSTRRGMAPKAALGNEQAAKETKRTAGIGKGMSNSIEVNKDDDPLDSSNAPETNTESGEVPNAVARTRKTQKAVKQEDNSVEALKSTRSTRGARTNDSTKTPAPIRGRPRRTPATAPAAVAVEVEVDKENAPRAQQTAGPSRKNVPDSSHEEVVVKVRTTRRTKAPPVKQEEDTPLQRPVKPRVTRSRARTKTN